MATTAQKKKTRHATKSARPPLEASILLSLRQIEEDWLRLTWLVTWSNKLRQATLFRLFEPFLFFAFFSFQQLQGVWRSQLGLAAKGGAQLEGVLLGLACSLASCGRQQSKRWSQWDISAFRWWEV
jgi:hypothetical protein